MTQRSTNCKPTLLVLVAGGGKDCQLTGEEIVSLNFWEVTPAVFTQLDASFQNFLSRSGGDLKAECYVLGIVSELSATVQWTVRVFASLFCAAIILKDYGHET